MVADGAFDLGQHALFAGLDQLEVAKAVHIGLDDRQDLTIAVIARLDAIDGMVELGRKARNVGKILQARRPSIFGDRQGVFGARQIGADHLDRAVLFKRRAVLGHGRHPVAQKDIDILVLHGGIGDRHG